MCLCQVTLRVVLSPYFCKKLACTFLCIYQCNVGNKDELLCEHDYFGNKVVHYSMYRSQGSIISIRSLSSLIIKKKSLWQSTFLLVALL